MTRIIYPALCLWLSGAAAFSSFHPARRPTAVQNIIPSSTSLSMGLTLYGHQGTRSPLVNWGAYELGLDISMGDLTKNPHPFRQIPCLTDDEDVLVFESGAILQYLHCKTMDKLSKSQAAAVTSWITWANASLDPICFLETPEGKVYDTGLKKPNKRLDTVNEILSSQKFLTGDDFTLADVAVASYLLYVLQFFPGTDVSRWPNIVRYMKECAERPAYAQAFGENVQANVVGQLNTDAPKKIFGMF
jgi:glutathione S-transferase